MKARELWKQQQEEIHNEVVQKGLKAAAIWGTAGILGHLALTRFVPRYAKHTLPFKVFILMAIPTAAFFTTTDVEAMEADRKFAQQFSITKADMQAIKGETKYTFDKEGIHKYIYDNQYHILGYGYLGLVGLSLIYNFGKKSIVMQQKLINTRMVAQTGAFMGVGLVAALNAKRPKHIEESVDVHFESMINKNK
jgi:hypothetical protein